MKQVLKFTEMFIRLLRHAKSEIDVMIDVVHNLLKKQGSLKQQIITKPKISHAKHLRDLSLNTSLKRRVSTVFD